MNAMELTDDVPSSPTSPIWRASAGSHCPSRGRTVSLSAAVGCNASASAASLWPTSTNPASSRASRSATSSSSQPASTSQPVGRAGEARSSLLAPASLPAAVSSAVSTRRIICSSTDDAAPGGRVRSGAASMSEPENGGARRACRTAEDQPAEAGIAGRPKERISGSSPTRISM
eukprot:scaffold118451_cov27-Tisochrysis_lutea.AAC.4